MCPCGQVRVLSSSIKREAAQACIFLCVFHQLRMTDLLELKIDVLELTIVELELAIVVLDLTIVALTLYDRRVRS